MFSLPRILGVADYSCLEKVTPQLIAEELYERAGVTYKLLSTLLRKMDDSEDAVNRRVGIATAVIMNLMSQKMSVYATKLGVTLIASGIDFWLLFEILNLDL